jgi:signal peptidase I
MRSKKDNRSIKEKYKVYFAAGITAWVIFMFIHPVTMAGDAMSPTIEEGNVIIVSKENFKRSPPELDTIVNFQRDFKEDEKKGINSVRRVVGVPGDEIEIKNGSLYRNGEAVKEPYATGQMGDNYSKVVLEKGEIFVLGDNREHSIDSRHLGPMEISKLRGTCSRIIWPISEWAGLK